MNSSNIIISRYKPYRYTINHQTTIIDSSIGRYIVKPQQKDLYTLFNYLDSRGFYHHPKIDYNYHNIENIYEYVEDSYLPNEQRLEELAKIVASLHNKTVYFKEIDVDNIKEIYEIIEENIDYMDRLYDGMFMKYCQKEFQSPSEYLFTRNYYQIKRSLDFAKSSLTEWFDHVNKKQFRVSVIHNNLRLNHFIYNPDMSILVSWDNYRIDSPIIDLVNLYKNEFENIDLHHFMQTYFHHFELLDDERKLLFIILALPFIVEENDDVEFLKTQKIKKLIEYLQKTEKLIGAYNTKEKEK
jgi:hypothetical protein